MCESIKNIGKKYGVAVYFKGNRTLQNILVSPKDKNEMANKSSIIYSYCCGEIGCDEKYVGESGRTFGERFREPFEDTFSNIPPPKHQWPYNINGQFQDPW